VQHQRRLGLGIKRLWIDRHGEFPKSDVCPGEYCA
jgi:hypothetical protein